MSTNTKAQHTPGPWRTILTRDGLRVCDENSRNVLNRSDSAEEKANAYVLAAAPDLLKALDVLIGEIGQPLRLDYELRDALAFAHAALAKARGDAQG